MSNSSQWQPGDQMLDPLNEKMYTYNQTWVEQPGEKLRLVPNDPPPLLTYRGDGGDALSPSEREAVRPILGKMVIPPKPEWIDKFTPQDQKPLVWAPAPGAFPKSTEPEVTVTIPKDPPITVGRWKCKVAAIVKTTKPPTSDPTGYWRSLLDLDTYRIWLEAAPDANDGRSVRQKWMNHEGCMFGHDVIRDGFEKFILEIEKDPDCCVKHKMLKGYDGTACIGPRSQAPPPALMPQGEPETATGYRFGFSGYKQAQQSIDTSGQWLAGMNVLSPPPQRFKLHGLEVVSDPYVPKNTVILENLK